MVNSVFLSQSSAIRLEQKKPNAIRLNAVVRKERLRVIDITSIKFLEYSTPSGGSSLTTLTRFNSLATSMTYEHWPVTNDICHWSLANSHMSFQGALIPICAAANAHWSASSAIRLS